MLSRLLAPGAGTTPKPAPSAPQRIARTPAPQPSPAAPVRTLARAVPGADAAGGAAGGGAASGGGGGGGGGHNSDENYAELLRRVREEQEQLGQLINHPF